MKFNKTHILLIFFFIIYALFPTNNSTIDAYYYASCIKYEQDLFHPHHLLYNFFGYLIYKTVNLFGLNIAPLGLMKIINSIAAVTCLYLFTLILKELKKNNSQILLLTFISASCFGFMRFATEDENYIIPIIFSLIASYYFIKFINYNKHKLLFLSGLFASVACLFHQIHIFWWLGLLLGVIIYFKNFKSFFIYLIPSAIVPLVYLAVFICINNHDFNIFNIYNFTDFIVRDFNTGSSELNFGFSNLSLNLYLTLVSFVRTFIQIHGIIPCLIQNNYIFIIPAIIFLTALILIILQIFKTKINCKLAYKQFINTHFFILAFQFLFAFYSVGNVEFMVMIPFLFLIIISEYLIISNKILTISGIALLIWNFAYGIFPPNYYKYNDNLKIIKLIKTQPDNIFILTDDNLINNQIYYYFGDQINKNIFKTPSNLKSRYLPLSNLDKQIKLCISKKNKVYTDCIYKQEVLNRLSIFENNENTVFFNKYKVIPCDTIITIIGKQYISEVKFKN